MVMWTLWRDDKDGYVFIQVYACRLESYLDDNYSMYLCGVVAMAGCHHRCHADIYMGPP